MKKHLALVVAWFVLTSQHNAIYCQSKERDVMRNLTAYDKAGPYDFSTSDWEARARWEREIREFVWTHWRARKLGYLHATYYTKEGDSTAMHLYIEPDQKRSWHALIEEDIDITDRLTHQRRVEHRQYDIRKVVRTKGNTKKEFSVILIDDKGTIVRAF